MVVVRVVVVVVRVEQGWRARAHLALGCAGEVALDHNRARDVVAEDGALGRDHQVTVLDHVNEKFVLAVPAQRWRSTRRREDGWRRARYERWRGARRVSAGEGAAREA